MNWLGFRNIKKTEIPYLVSPQEDKSISNYMKMISTKVGNLSKSWESSERGNDSFAWESGRRVPEGLDDVWRVSVKMDDVSEGYLWRMEQHG